MEKQNRPALKLFSKIFKHAIPDQRADYGDNEIRTCKDVVEGERQTLPVPTGNGEFSHQQIGIKQKDDERNFDHGPPERGEAPAIFLLLLHGVYMVLTTASGWHQESINALIAL
ncbi:MAG: hypothetical protein ACLP7O_09125 [Terracidiphilus sp.]